MFSTQPLMRFGALIVCAAGIANAAYTLEDSYDSTNFFSEFTFFSGTDPTNGFVDYVSSEVANTSAIAGISNDQIYLGVDHTTENPSAGRAAARVTSNTAYTHGLFIADIAHMPGGICGVWPAFWTFGPNWPSSGEIDIIEGVNAQVNDEVTLHTSATCSMSNSGSASGSTLTESNCNDGNGNDGCPQTTTTDNNFGTGFNSIGGGVYAMEWTSDQIAIYFFPRTSIPSDITSGSPDPSTWGTPMTNFVGDSCDIDDHFMNHNIVFDTTFCGDWAGDVWASGSCASLASTCDSYVSANPSAFADAYWMINSVKVYSESSSDSSSDTDTQALAYSASAAQPTSEATSATSVAITATSAVAATVAPVVTASAVVTTAAAATSAWNAEEEYETAAPDATLSVLSNTYPKRFQA